MGMTVQTKLINEVDVSIFNQNIKDFFQNDIPNGAAILHINTFIKGTNYIFVALWVNPPKVSTINHITKGGYIPNG